MTFVLKDRVKETTNTTGTTDFGLAGAVVNCRSWADIGNTVKSIYTALDPITGAWETGICTYSTTGPTLARTTVKSNSLFTTAKINFLNSPIVWCDIIAALAIFSDDAGNVLLPAGLLQFAGATSSFPALKRSAATIAARLADDSADATLTALTQAAADNSNKVATTAYADRNITVPVRWFGIGGGGSGGGQGSSRGGGGGGGGPREGFTTLLKGTTYSIVIGAGGSSGGASNGSNTTGLGYTMLGGGYGGSYSQWGANGGASGGGGCIVTGGGTGGTATNIDQGTNGGNSSAGGTTNDNGAGGGGAGRAGADQVDTGTGQGAGGIGIVTTILPPSIATSASVGQVVNSGIFSGSPQYNVYYGGGGTGGGDGVSGNPKSGGLGGGGTGGGTGAATAGGANTGGGGGGPTPASGGGSGVFILRVPTALYSGTTTGSPTVTTDGQDTILIFKSSGSYTA